MATDDFLPESISTHHPIDLTHAPSYFTANSSVSYVDNKMAAALTTSTVVAIVASNTVAVVVCVTAMIIVGSVLIVGRNRRRRRELDYRLAQILVNSYWPIEPEVVTALRHVEAMKSTTLFSDVTAFDVLVYKFRSHRRYHWRKLLTPMTSQQKKATVVSATKSRNDNNYRSSNQPEQPPCEESDVDVTTPLIDGLVDGPHRRDYVSSSASQQSTDAIQTLEKIERLFDTLSIQLSVNQDCCPCPKSLASCPFAQTVCCLARATAAVWTDEHAPVVRRLVVYFGGRAAAAATVQKAAVGWRLKLSHWLRYRRPSPAVVAFDTARIQCGSTDADLEHRVKSRLPYVDALRLSGWRFVLADVCPSPLDETKRNVNFAELNSGGHNDMAFDIRAKIRFIEERLSRMTSGTSDDGARALSTNLWPEMVDLYRTAVELAVSANLITARSLSCQFPDFYAVPPSTNDATQTPQIQYVASDEKIVILIRHLVRLMCGKTDTLRRLETDRRFVQLVTRLHDALYGWTKAPAAMRSAVDQCRANIIAYARVLTVAATFEEDADMTRHTLELAESQLYRHLDQLTRRRVELAEAARRRRRELAQRRELTDEDSGEDDDYLSAISDDVTMKPYHASQRLPACERWLRSVVEPAAALNSVSSLHYVASETSVYTMASSRAASPPPISWRVSPSPTLGQGSNSNLVRPIGRRECSFTADGCSILSSGSSISPYASLSSTGWNSSGSAKQSPTVGKNSRFMGATSARATCSPSSV